MDDTPVSTARALFPRGLRQPEDSYRFGADALLLAAFAADCLAGLPGATPRKVAELGSGCGAALLGLCLRLAEDLRDAPPLRALGLELDAALCHAAGENARRLGLETVCAFRQGDLADTHLVRDCGENSFHLVLANPPYARAGSGRPSASARRDRALRDVRPLPEGSRGPDGPATGLPGIRQGAPADVLAVFCRAARRLLRHHGLFCCIFPAEDLPRLLIALERERLGCRRLWPVCARAGEPALRVLVLARKDAAPQCRLEPPLPLHEGPGRHPAALRFCPWLGAGHAGGGERSSGPPSDSRKRQRTR